MEEEQLKLTTEHPTLADRIGRIEKLEAELIRKAAEIMNVGIQVSHSTLFVIGALKRLSCDRFETRAMLCFFQREGGFLSK
ncbi:MAG: hypothetical protein WCC90_04250 [Methylocella sp.]